MDRQYHGFLRIIFSSLDPKVHTPLNLVSIFKPYWIPTLAYRFMPNLISFFFLDYENNFYTQINDLLDSEFSFVHAYICISQKWCKQFSFKKILNFSHCILFLTLDHKDIGTLIKDNLLHMNRPTHKEYITIT